MKYKLTLALLSIFLLTFTLFNFAFAALSTLGVSIDTVTDSYFTPSPDGTAYYTGKGIRCEETDNGTSYVYLLPTYNASAANETRVYAYRVTYTGTFAGSTVIGYMDFDHDRNEDSTIVKVTSVSGIGGGLPMYALTSSSSNGVSCTLHCSTFTLTSAGSISAAIDTQAIGPSCNHGLYGHDAWGITDGYIGVVASTWYETGGGLDRCYVTASAIEIQTSDGDIIGGVSSVTPIYYEAYSSNAWYRPSVFKITNGEDWEDCTGFGRFGIVCLDASGSYLHYDVNFASFFCENSGGVPTMSDGKWTETVGGGATNEIELNINERPYPPMRYGSTGNNWLYWSQDQLSMIEITQGGTISATIIDQIDWTNNWSPCQSYPVWIGGNRYITLSSAVSASTVYAAGFDIDSTDLSISMIIDDQETTGINRISGSRLQLIQTGQTGYYQVASANSSSLVYGYSFLFYVPPTVSTDSVSNITETSAICNGELVDEGANVPTTIGVCWSDFSANPSISGSHTATTGAFLTGETWADSMPNLTAGTLYYTRAYAQSASGIGYGDTIQFYTAPAYSNYLLNFTYDADHISGTPTYTIQDQSGENHDATFTLAPNPAGISGTLGPLIPASETDASYLVTGENLVWAAPDEPENMYEEQDLEGKLGIPGQTADDIADMWGVTSAIIWSLVVTAMLVMVGFGSTRAIHSPFWTAIMVGSLIFFCWEMGIFAGWLALSYPFTAAGIIVSRKFY